MNVVLVVDSEGDVAKDVHDAFAGRVGSYAIMGRATGASAVSALREGIAIDVIVSNDRLADMDAVELVGVAKKYAPAVPVIMISGRPSVEGYLKAVSAGVHDFIARPINGPVLRRIVAAALEFRGPASCIVHTGHAVPVGRSRTASPTGT